MDKEQYEKLPVEHQYQVMKSYSDSMYNAVSKRMEILLAICALAATLLVVATFNNNLIALDNWVRFVLSVLLFIIPVALLIYNADLKNAQRSNLEYLKKILGEDIEPKKTSGSQWISIWSPDILIGFIVIIVVTLIYKIWSNV